MVSQPATLPGDENIAETCDIAPAGTPLGPHESDLD